MAKQSERNLSSDLGPNFSRASNFPFGVLLMLPFARAAGLEVPDVRLGVLGACPWVLVFANFVKFEPPRSGQIWLAGLPLGSIFDFSGFSINFFPDLNFFQKCRTN